MKSTTDQLETALKAEQNGSPITLTLRNVNNLSSAPVIIKGLFAYPTDEHDIGYLADMDTMRYQIEKSITAMTGVLYESRFSYEEENVYQAAADLYSDTFEPA